MRRIAYLLTDRARAVGNVWTSYVAAVCYTLGELGRNRKGRAVL